MKIVFTSGTARGGTNLRTYGLRAHPNISLSIDAVLPLFKYYRYRVLNPDSANLLTLPENWNEPLPDVFFNNQALKDLQKIWTTGENVTIIDQHWDFLLPEIEKRTKLASPELLDDISGIVSNNFKQSIVNYIEIIDMKSQKDNAIVGFNENWVSEFFPNLKILFPDAKFIHYIRDPRSVLYSSEFHEPDAKKHPAVFSMSRHVRKNMSLAMYFSRLDIFANNYLITKYEDCVANLDQYFTNICDFLEINFAGTMSNFLEYKSNENRLKGVFWETFVESVNCWEEIADGPLINAVEWLSQYEMINYGYQLVNKMPIITDKAETFLELNMDASLGWSENKHDIQEQIKKEKARFKLLNDEVNPLELLENYNSQSKNYSTIVSEMYGGNRG
jgi:hypothetical protein